MRGSLAMILLMGSVSCSSNDGGSTGSGTFTTSVSSTATLSSLTSAQQTQLCNDLKSFAASSTEYADAVEVGCRLAGIVVGALSNPTSDGALQQACMPVYTNCKATPPDQSTVSNVACTAPPATCQATVAELTACLNDTFSELHGLLSSVPSCSQVTLAYLKGDAGISSVTSASCTAFKSKCPGSTQ